MALVVSALVINWAMISLAHIKFRRAKQQQGVATRFPALLYPLGNWVCLLFMAAVLVIMLITPGMAISVYLIPVWIAILGVGYLFKQKKPTHESTLISSSTLHPFRVQSVVTSSHFPAHSNFIHITDLILQRKIPLPANNSLHTEPGEQSMDNNKLSVKEKIGYGMGDAGCNIIFGAIMLFVNYFYTDIFGLAPALVGVLLLSVRVIDAVTDPIMGAIADRTRSKYGRFRPWLLWIAFPYALFSVLMFTTPEWSYNSKVIYAFVTYFLLSLTYTAINIPYCSLGGVITNDPKERVACQSYRFVMVGIATLLLSLTLLPMADWFGGDNKAKGYQMAMTVLALIGTCMFLFCFATVRERIRPAVQTNDELKNDLKDVWKNDQWVRILLLTLCNVCPGFIRMAATMYYVTWVMGQSTHFATLFISLGVVGMMFGSMLAKVLTDRWCKLKVFFWTNIVLAIFSCVLLLRPESHHHHRGALLPAEHPASDPFPAALVADGRRGRLRRVENRQTHHRDQLLRQYLLPQAGAGDCRGDGRLPALLVRLRRRGKSAKRRRHQRYRAAVHGDSGRRLSDYRRRGASAES
jgi:sugar (glycoside-pentoside-hexuronide) transporter